MKNLLLSLIILLMPAICSADEYYIGQWEWVAGPDESYWQAPHADKLTGVIDLRNIPDQSEKGGPPKGYAIFAYSEIIPDPKVSHLGGNLDETPNTKAIGAIKSKINVNPKSITIRDIIYELLTTESDPTGVSRWKPLRPDKNNKMKINLGTAGVIKEITLIPNVSPEWPIVVAAMQEDYRKLIRTERWDKVARVLDYWQDQFDVPYETFIPDGEIRLAALPHETTITESFDKADGDILGPDLTWTEFTGDIDILTNKARSVSVSPTNNEARAETALSSDDHYVQADVSGSNASSGTYVGVILRKDLSTTRTFYCARITVYTAANVKIFKRIAGTATNLSSTTAAQSEGVSYTLKGQVDGSTLRAYINSVEDGGSPVTDTSITGNLYTGIYTFAVASNQYGLFNNYEAGDIAASTDSYSSRGLGRGIGRGVSR